MLKNNSIITTPKKVINKLFFGEKSYLWLCFGVPIAIMYVIYLALGIHPFGDASVLVLDLNAQYVYFYEALRECVHGDQSLLYSFSRQLGGEFMGIYAYYLASPLSYIVALFPQHRILEALLTIILLKTGLCGLSFGFYLHKNSKNPNKIIIVAFSVMYALCSFAVPNEEFATAFRLLKFVLIGLSAWLGYFGFLVGLFSILVHIARLKSFHTPYLTPFVDAKLNNYQDEKDSFVRFPLRLLWKRPIYSNPHERTKLKKKD